MSGKFERLIEYSDLFNDTIESIDQIILSMDKIILLRLLSTISYLNSKRSNSIKVISQFIRELIPDYDLTETCRKIDSLGENSVIVSSVSVLRLMERVIILEPKSTESQVIDKSRIGLNILKLLLLQNQEIGKEETGYIDRIPKEYSDKLYPVFLLSSLSSTELVNRDDMVVVYSQVIKIKLLLEFINSNDYIKSLANSLVNDLNFQKPEEFIREVLKVIKLGYRGQLSFSISENGNLKFYDFFSINNISAHDKNDDFIQLRERPLYKVNSTEFLILNTQFVFEKLYKNWFFELNKIHSSKTIKPIIFKNFKSGWGKYFIEEFLLEAILKKVFKEKEIQFSGSMLKNQFPKIEGEPDYYIRDWGSIYLFEMKDTLLKASVKTSRDFNLLIRELKNNFLENQNGKPKAIKQLIASIKKNLLNCQEFDLMSNSYRNKIFPILCLPDEYYNAPGMNYLLNTIFQDELKKMDLDLTNVRPLVIITLDTLIIYSRLADRDRYKLEKLIDCYAEKHLRDIKKNPKNIDYAISRFSSFHHFFLKEYPNINISNAELNGLLKEISAN